MPRKNKTGPPRGSRGPKSGIGRGRGRASVKGIGKKKGGGKGGC